jgi:chromosome segregation ATPase
LGKAAFVEALSELDEIEANIDEANNKTMETKKLVGNSKELAEAALATAIEAQKQAENLAFQSEQLAEAVETLAESATKTDQGLRNIDDLLLILNKSSIALENARETRKTSEAELQQAALLELKAKNESEKMDKLEEIVRGIQFNIGSFEKASNETLNELLGLEGIMENAQKFFRKRVARKLKAHKENYALEEKRDDIKKDIYLLENELKQLQKIYDSIPDKCYNHVRLEQAGQ